jgi:hypothetical protein
MPQGNTTASQPITWKSTKDGSNIGDEKTFPDGSQRKLDYAPVTGLRRWLGTGGKENKEKTPSAQNSPANGQAIPGEFEYPKQIIKEEWIKYNAYLTEDNPFLFASSYEDVTSTWFKVAFELDNRIDIINEEIFLLDSFKPIDYIERKSMLQVGLDKIEEAYKTLDNQFLAYLMYKINVLIVDIERFDMNFDYNGWINKGRTWNELYQYLTDIQQPDYFKDNE